MGQSHQTPQQPVNPQVDNKEQKGKEVEKTSTSEDSITDPLMSMEPLCDPESLIVSQDKTYVVPPPKLAGKLPMELFRGLQELLSDLPLSGEKDVSKDGRIDVDGVPVDVRDSEDAGDFYCEFVLHALLSAAEDLSDKSLVKGGDGPLAGFIHLPEDPEMIDPTLKRTQEERHKKSRKVVGATLRGYFEQIKLNGGLKPDEPMRILMTGFEPWDYVKDNPSGDFVKHTDNTDAAMKFAFGDRLDESKTTSTTDSDGAITMRYTILNPPDGKPLIVEVFLRILPTADGAIDGSDGSIPDLFDDIDPHAVLSMGVYADLDPSTTTHYLETTANHANASKKTASKKSRALVGSVKSGSDKIKKEKEERDR